MKSIRLKRLFFIAPLFVFITSISAKNLRPDILITSDEIVNPKGSVYDWDQWEYWEAKLATQCYTDDQNALTLCKQSIMQLQKANDRYSKFALARAYYLRGSFFNNKEGDTYLKREASVYEGLIQDNPKDVQALFQLALTKSDGPQFRKMLKDILKIDASNIGAMKQLALSYRNSLIKKNQKTGASYYQQIYEAYRSEGIVSITNAVDYHISLQLDGFSDDAKRFQDEVVKDLKVDGLLTDFHKLDLSDDKNFKGVKDNLIVLCDARLVEGLEYANGCRSALEKISQFENLPLSILEFSISMGQVFLGNNYDSDHELSDDQEMMKSLYILYLDRDENNIKLWFDYAYFFLDNLQKKEVYKKIIKIKKSAPTFTWYNLATIYIQEGNVSEALKYLQQGLTVVSGGDRVVYQNLIDDLNNRPETY